MSEQDKRPLYMGTYERYKKEIQVKHDDMITQLTAMKLLIKYNTILAGVALGIALVAFVI